MAAFVIFLPFRITRSEPRGAISLAARNPTRLSLTAQCNRSLSQSDPVDRIERPDDLVGAP